MNINKLSIINGILLFILAGVITASAIYLTPLKHLNVLEPTIDDIKPAEFYERYKANPDQYVLLDVRGTGSYNRLHAAGSESQPLHTLYTERLFLPKNTDKTIVFICSGGVASGVAYHYLEHHGFLNVQRIEGGIEAWELAGLPTESTTTN
ncbi:MAG: rhodanese-like domain-containing protein [Candidatus Paceibacterota bacterium]